jgi:hypothetical protein
MLSVDEGGTVELLNVVDGSPEKPGNLKFPGATVRFKVLER